MSHPLDNTLPAPTITPATLATIREAGLMLAMQSERGRWRDPLADPSLLEATEFPLDPGEHANVSIALLPGLERRPEDAMFRLVGKRDDRPLVELQRIAALVAAMVRADRRVDETGREVDSLSGQLADTYEEVTLIYQLSSGMKINRSAEEFFTQACMDLMQVMQVRAAGFLLCDRNGRIDSDAIVGELLIDPQTAQRLRGDLMTRLAASHKPLLINQLAHDPTFHYLSSSATRMLAVALNRQDAHLGALFCFDKLSDDFNTTDSKLLASIGNQTSIYLENSHLFADARGLMMGMLHALTSAVDAKDAYTCGHSQRVALFAQELARQASLPESLCERVYMAGLLHDVGKIGVNESVLKKPGKLTASEFEEMKKHVEIGARILRDIRQVEDLVPGVLHHHERYDGRGYPHGLSGHAIPLLGRVLCVADCFDAMTSNRTYRTALPVEVALMEIRRCAGTQFDPALADAFLAVGADRLRELISGVTGSVSLQLRAA